MHAPRSPTFCTVRPRWLPEMALRTEKAFGPDMDHLLRMPFAYDVAKTRAHARGVAIKR